MYINVWLSAGVYCPFISLSVYYSMMAVRFRAKKVYACELSPAMVALSRQVLEANGMSNDVSLIHKVSTEVSVPEHLPERYGTMLYMWAHNHNFCVYMWLKSFRIITLTLLHTCSYMYN